MKTDMPKTMNEHNHRESQKKIDLLISAGWIITMQSLAEVFKHHAVAVHEGKILEIGPEATLLEIYKPDTHTQLPSHVVIPGLINAHGHASMTLMRGFADDMALDPWLKEKIWPTESAFVNEDFVRTGAELGIAEMLLGGTTTFADMYFFPESVAKVVRDVGMRAQLCSPILDFPTNYAKSADDYIALSTRLHDEYRQHERISIAFGPHAPYTVSDDPLLKIRVLAEELDLNIHIHLHETKQEILDHLKLTGMRPLERLEKLELLSPRLQSVHMTQVTEDDIEMLVVNDVRVIHCPASNLKLASGFCPLSRLQKAGLTIGLGTDSACSNNEINMLSELRLAALLDKGMTEDPCSVSAWQALALATIDSAKALGLEQQIGSLEPGKYADMVAIDLDAINTTPYFDPVSAVAYSAQSAQVTHSWVHGRPLLENKTLTRLELPRVLKEVSQWREKLKNRT